MKVMCRSAGFFRIVLGPLSITFNVLALVVVRIYSFQLIPELLFSFSPAMIILSKCLDWIRGYDLLLLLRLLLRIVVIGIDPRCSVPLSGTLGRRICHRLLLVLVVLVLVLLILGVHDDGYVL